MSNFLNKTFCKVNPYLLLIVILHFYISIIDAQNIGNEWINYNQQYYKINIERTGVYKITATQLANAGIPTGSFSPQNLQLFQNGVEIPVYVDGEQTGILNYIEFYAKANDGWFDVGMYSLPNTQTNPYHSLITDTASVFLTWNKNFNNKRLITVDDQNFTGNQPKQFCFCDTLVQFTKKYYEGDNDPVDSEYTEAEGWFDDILVTLGRTITKTVSTPNLHIADIPSKVSLAFISYSTHKHHIKVNGAGIIIDTIFTGYKTINYSKTVETNNLTTDNKIEFSNINDQNSVTSNIAVSYIKIAYPALFDFNNQSQKHFYFETANENKTYIEISNFITNNTTPIIYDLSNNKRILTKVENNIVKALIPASVIQPQMFITNTSQIITNATITKSPITNHAGKNKKTIIITNYSLQNSAQQYAAYRDAYIVYTNDIYDQFGYGIKNHPLSIRNFLSYTLNNWSQKPEFLIIIGKGISADKTRFNATNFNSCIVPPMGVPASDVLLGCKTINGSPIVSSVAIGRIPATQNTEVTNYLEKVQMFERNNVEEWMKRIIHFGGGNNAFEQQLFASYLKKYEIIIEDEYFGGNVNTFLKKSSDPISMSKTDSITSLINGGVSLITFFGHGSSTGFDQNIDQPSAYNNINKYPLIIANSCYSGNIFLPGKSSQSEEWTLIANKGAIGFFAMVYQGYQYQLNQYSDGFYKQLTKTSYAQPIGKIIQAAQSNMAAIAGTTGKSKITIHGFNLNGDPLIVLNSFNKPDFTTTQSDINTYPENLTNNTDSFIVNIVVKNIAKTTRDTFAIKLLRTYPDLSIEEFEKKIPGLYYRDSIKFKLPVNISKSLGNNTISILLDNKAEIDELNETNNSITISKIITSSALTPVYPNKYAMLTPANFVLQACTGNPFLIGKNGTFQIDTSHTFDSPALISTNIDYQGGVVKWEPSINLNTQQTFFWRTKPSSDNNKNTNWQVSSFNINTNASGWQQNHFAQYIENNFSMLHVDQQTRQFRFNEQPATLRAYNIGSPTIANYTFIGYSVDGNGGVASCGMADAIVVAVIDTIDNKIWLSDRGNYGHVNYPICQTGSSSPNGYFVFRTDTTSLDKLVDFIENDVPFGTHVLIYSFLKGNFTKWKARHYDAFYQWGATEPRFLADKYAYIAYLRKGMPGYTKEVAANNDTEHIELKVELSTSVYYGSMSSNLIGPSKKWNSINWLTKMSETDNPTEIAYIQVFGTADGINQTLLFDTISANYFDISGINPVNYPFIILRFFTQDKTYRTPAQLKYWQVNYLPTAELAINPSRKWLFYSDTIERGDSAWCHVAFENIGYSTTDSITINYWLQNQKNNVFNIESKKIPPIIPGNFYIDSTGFNTLEYSGDNTFCIEINPVNSPGFIYEPYRFNNIAQKNIYIKNDQTNPILDVTFDGKYITDGELVSATPQITIQLKDDNRFIALDDTSLFAIYIKSLHTGIEQKIELTGNPEITFHQAQLPNNKAKLIYSPTFSSDGIYELRAQAVDKSGNESGQYDYHISFEIINESTITNVFNYPNPFSSSTRFVFELTGSQIPDQMRIEIYTVTGRVIKVIYYDELGHVNIGKNITQYAWDGRDMYGNLLANGVYFYKVYARIAGHDIKIRDNNTNQFFKNGFGKLYIMR